MRAPVPCASARACGFEKARVRVFSLLCRLLARLEERARERSSLVSASRTEEGFGFFSLLGGVDTKRFKRFSAAAQLSTPSLPVLDAKSSVGAVKSPLLLQTCLEVEAPSSSSSSSSGTECRPQIKCGEAYESVTSWFSE